MSKGGGSAHNLSISACYVPLPWFTGRMDSTLLQVAPAVSWSLRRKESSDHIALVG